MSLDPKNNSTPTESNTARKKRAKAEASKAESTPVVSTPVDEQAEPSTNGALSQHDSPYIKELQKQIRNVTKKLNSTAKLDAILAEHPGVSLDDLVDQRKINTDQREQALRKPGLQSNLSQLEEQIAQYKKLDADFQSRMSSHTESLSASHKAELETLKAQLQQEVEEKSRIQLREKLLTFSQFLRAAASKRAIHEDSPTEESRAFEGVLLLVYGGDEKAVDAAEKLIEGTDDAVLSVEGEILPVKYAAVKAESQANGSFAEEEEAPTELEIEPQTTSAETETPSDPTIAYAGLNEISDAQASDLPVMSAADDGTIREASTDGAHANAAAEQQWDNNTTAGEASASMEESNLDDSFEMVPRNPSETEAVHEPAQPQSTNSWADDATAAAAETSAPEPAVPAVADDGFHEVPGRGPRGGHRGQGEGRGRVGRGGRGGFRGDGRGRGRGRGDGHRGGPRGGPRGGQGNAAGANGPVRS